LANRGLVVVAGEINLNMPHYVFGRLAEARDMRLGLPLNQASVLLIGISYKKNVSDTRESPALKLIERLAGLVADVAFHDPHFGNIPKIRRHPALAGRRSVRLTLDSVAAYHAVVIVTDHDIIDDEPVAKHSRLIVDTRNALGSRHIACDHMVKT
jgi:UDP-N-acetyl-D-glucosamine dehydrogenase